MSGDKTTTMDDLSHLDRSKSLSSSTGRSVLRAVTFRKSSDSSQVEKGALGLTTVSNLPRDAVADVIFVHGLGGGSRKTWSKNEDPALFWPGQWLPQDPEFRDVRIHTFGYDSDWDKESILNIHDFAKSLLRWIKDCPAIPRDGQVSIAKLFLAFPGPGAQLWVRRANL